MVNMQARKPDYVTINNRKVKVQQWQAMPERVVLAALVHGDSTATDLITQLREDMVTLQYADSPALSARPEITHHRAAGTGPATVHRIEVTLWLAIPAAPNADDSMEAKLDRILDELQQLRAEVAELRGARRPGTSAIAAPLVAGRTMLDFEIENGEN